MNPKWIKGGVATELIFGLIDVKSERRRGPERGTTGLRVVGTVEYTRARRVAGVHTRFHTPARDALSPPALATKKRGEPQNPETLKKTTGDARCVRASRGRDGIHAPNDDESDATRCIEPRGFVVQRMETRAFAAIARFRAGKSALRSTHPRGPEKRSHCSWTRPGTRPGRAPWGRRGRCRGRRRWASPW